MKKKIVCLALVLCAALLLTACGQQQESFPNQPKQDSTQTQQSNAVQIEVPAEPAQQQQVNFDDGTYDPASEEGGQQEAVSSVPTPTLCMQREYAGATPVRIDPIDKPTPTAVPTLTFTYAQYTASNLKLAFEGPAGWLPDESAQDTYVLSYPNPAMDYEAKIIIRSVNVGKDYTQKELIAEAKAQADALRATGEYKSFDPSDTAARFFIDGNGVYIAYKGTLNDTQETGVAGRIIVNTVNKTLYILYVTYPRALADTFAENVYNKVRHSMKLVE